MARCTPLALLPLLLAGCAASIPPVSVTRFHLAQAIAPGTFAPVSTIVSLEQTTYDAAVARDLQRLGFLPSAGDAVPVYTVSTEMLRDVREGPPRRSPFSIGIGGGTGGYGGGYGGGVGAGASFGIGHRRSGDSVTTRLAVQIRDRASGSVIWEGRAETVAPSDTPAAQPGLAADKLSSALFRDFPGVSGRTISVP